MTEMTQAQAKLLATADEGVITLEPATRRTGAALVRLGVAAEDPDAPDRLRVIDAPAGPPRHMAEAANEKDVAGPAAGAESDLPLTKTERLLQLLKRSGGATLPELQAATGWQAHSVRGALAGTIKKKLKMPLVSERSAAGRTYRIEAEVRA